MKNLPPTLRGDKLYSSGLTVCGERVNLREAFGRQRSRFTNKNLNLLSLDGPVEEADFFKDRKEKPRRKQLQVQVHTTDYKNPSACSKELRQIYQTNEVSDFKRIFNQLYKSKLFQEKVKYADDVLLNLNAEEIYEEHFNQHYVHLADLIQSQ